MAHLALYEYFPNIPSRYQVTMEAVPMQTWLQLPLAKLLDVLQYELDWFTKGHRQTTCCLIPRDSLAGFSGRTRLVEE